MISKNKYLIFLLWNIIFSIDSTETSNYMVLTASHIFGIKNSSSCFEVLTSNLKQMIVHTQENIVGFTFKFINGTIESYFENPIYLNNYTIDLINLDITSVNVMTGKGIASLQFELYNYTSNNSSMTQQIGQSNGCLSYLNSRFFNSKSLVIKSIQGCFDTNNSTYFPYMAFSYSFSQTTLGITASTVITETTTTIVTTYSNILNATTLTETSLTTPYDKTDTPSSITNSITTRLITTTPTTTLSTTATTASTTFSDAAYSIAMSSISLTLPLTVYSSTTTTYSTTTDTTTTTYSTTMDTTTNTAPFTTTTSATTLSTTTDTESLSLLPSLPIELFNNSSFFNIFINGSDTHLFKNTNPFIKSCRNLASGFINNVEYNLVSDQTVGVFLYDTNWNYVSTFSFPSIFYAIVANNFYYFSLGSGSYGLVKTTVNSTEIVEHHGNSGGVYRSLYYDSIGSRILAAGLNTNTVEIFDLNLKLLSSISLNGIQTHGVTFYNSCIFVTFWSTGSIEAVSNGVKNTFTAQCATQITSINVDNVGYFVITCYGTGRAYLYDENLAYTNKSILINSDSIIDARLDTNNRLAICSANNVYIFN